MPSAINATGSTPASKQNLKGLEQPLDTLEFLQLFTQQLQSQDPLDPMDNSELMGQMGQITNLQMMQDLTSSLGAMLDQSALLQAAGLIGKTVDYANNQTGDMATQLVTDVKVNEDGGIRLGLADLSTIDISDVKGLH